MESFFLFFSLPPSWEASGAQCESNRLPPMRSGFISRRRCHYVRWVCRWFSFLFREVFLRVLRFFPLLKNQHLSNFNSIWNERTRLKEFNELLSASWVNKLQFTIYSRSRPSTTFLESRSCLQATTIHYHWPAIFCLRLHGLFPCRCY